MEIKRWIEDYKINLVDGFSVNEKGDLCYLENNKEIVLCNFLLKPTGLILKLNDGGEILEKKYVFEGVLKGRERLEKKEVSENEIGGHKWIKNNWSFCKIYSSNEKQAYKYIEETIYLMLENLPITIEYASIGWQKYKNRWFYLHSNGVIGASPGDVRTSQKNFVFDMDDTIDEKEAFTQVMNILDICDHKLTYSLLAYLLTSIITTPLLSLESEDLSPNYSLWIVGDTGFGKSTFTTFFTRIFRTKNLVQPDDSAPKEIQEVLLNHKDCVSIVDDFGTSKTPAKRYAAIEKIESVIRKYGDRNISLSSQSKGLVAITGETFFKSSNKDTGNLDESTQRRSIRVEMVNLFNEEYDSFSKDILDRFSYYSNRKYIQTFAFHYIEWMSKKLNSDYLEQYVVDYRDMRREIQSFAKTHGRYQSSFAHQILAFKTFMQYGLDNGFISSDSFFDKCNYSKTVFTELMKDQYKVIYEKIVRIFLDNIKKLILQGRITISKSTILNEGIYQGTVNIERGKELLILNYQEVFNMAFEDLSGYSDKMLGKYLRSHNLIVYNGTTTTMKFPTGVDKQCRAIKLKADKIPDIMKAIEEAQNQEIQGNLRGGVENNPPWKKRKHGKE